MGNITFGNNYFILSKFSSIPKTSKIEQDRANLVKEHEDFIAFENSQELKDFYELEKYLSSKEYSDLMSSIETGKKEEQEKKNKYESQKKSKKLKDYFRFKESPKLKNYNDFVESKELNDYEDLEKLVTSNEFASNKKSLEDQKAAEDQKEKEYNSLKKSKPFKTYFKFKNSAKLKEFNSIAGSKELKDFEELEKLINSDEFRQKENAADPKEFKNAEEGRKQQEYKNLKKSRNIKFYYKFGESSKYKSYLEFEKSEGLKNFHKLQDYINSDEFKQEKIKTEKELNEINAQLKDYGQKKKSKQFKDFYKFQNSQKFKDFQVFDKSKELADYLELEKHLASDEHKELLISLDKKEKAENDKKKQYEEFKNSKKYKWYLELKDSDKFDELKRWEITFEDNFDSDKLNIEKWITRYFWGDKLINDAYALETDTAFPTDGKNIEISNNILRIVTRREKTNGKVWKQPFGFMPQDFDYTTGLISTAKHHRQKYGKIEAKIKVNYAKPVNHNFWMASDKILPHVDILKFDNKKSKVDMAHHWGDTTDKKGSQKQTADFKGLDITQDFFIYALDWTKDKLTWKINGIVVNEQTKGVPQEEMYMVFSTGLQGKVDESKLPAAMEIDWVRCYQEV